MVRLRTTNILSFVGCFCWLSCLCYLIVLVGAKWRKPVAFRPYFQLIKLVSFCKAKRRLFEGQNLLPEQDETVIGGEEC